MQTHNLTCYVIKRKLYIIHLYHASLNIILSYPDPKPPYDNWYNFYNFCKENYSNISSLINGLDWNSTLASLDFETRFNEFFYALHLSILKCLPKF